MCLWLITLKVNLLSETTKFYLLRQFPCTILNLEFIQILRMDTCLSTPQISRLRAGTAWLSNGGNVVYKLPRNARMRSAPYPIAEAEAIANSIGAPTPPRHNPLSQSIWRLKQQ